MNIKALVILGSFSVLIANCAHKKIENEPAKLAAAETKIEKPVEKVAEKASEKKDSEEHVKFNCVLGKDSRVVTIQKGAKRCEVHYTKSGAEEQVAWAEKTPALCDKVFDNVRTNIEKGGFKCDNEKDVQKTAAN